MRKHSWVLILAAGCAAPHAESAPEPEKPVKPTVEAENAEWRRIADELTRGRTVGEQQKLFEAERHFQLALAWFNKADFEKAKVEAQFAVATWPEHLAARKLLWDIGDLIVGGPTRIEGIGEHDLRVAQVTMEQKQLEISNHILHGTRFLEAKMYASALRELENAEFKIRNLPYDVAPMNDLLPKVRAMISQAKSSIPK